MVRLASFSRHGDSLYLEIRKIELHGCQGRNRYEIQGVAGDGCAEAFVRVELADQPQVELLSICNDDGSGELLEDRVDLHELRQLILESLDHLYFCVDSPPGRRLPGRVSGYVENGCFYRFAKSRPRPHRAVVAEQEPIWLTA